MGDTEIHRDTQRYIVCQIMGLDGNVERGGEGCRKGWKEIMREWGEIIQRNTELLYTRTHARERFYDRYRKKKRGDFSPQVSSLFSLTDKLKSSLVLLATLREVGVDCRAELKRALH